MSARDDIAAASPLAKARELYLNAPAEALALADAVLAALPPGAGAVERAEAQRVRGTALVYLGRFEEAFAQLAEALALLPDDAGVARLDLLRAHAIAHEQLGALEESLEWAVRAAEQARALGDPGRLADALLTLGVALSRSGEHGVGLERYHEALALYEQQGDVAGTVQALNNIGIGNKNLGRFDDAVAHVRLAMARAEASGDAGGRAVAAANLIEPLARLGRHDEARAALADALQRLEHAGYLAALTHVRVQAGELQLDEGDLAGAQAAFEAALALAQRTGSRNHAARAHLGLARVHKAAGRFEAALAQHEAYHAAERAQFNDDSARRLRALQVRYDLQRARQDAELHRLRAAELAAQSRTDALTGLANRRHLDERLAAELDAALAAQQPLAVALADIDDFKQVNDRLGHATGDAVLRTLATLLRERVRGSDLVSRYGGEEFCVVMPATALAEGAALCERLRAAVAAHDWPALHPQLKVTLSVGVAALSAGALHATPAALLREADHRLYDAKRRGKNRVRHTG